jgi:hypothetical protein
MAMREVRSEVTLDTLKAALERSWTRQTSANPVGWSEENPAYGQCAVTALVVNDFLGGRLVRVEATSHEEKVSHYFNELQNGQRVDLTLAQFPAGTHFSQPEYRERDYVMSYAPTAERYRHLRDRVLLTLHALGIATMRK